MQNQGTVKFFNNAKGFGFIQPDDGSDKDLFVHVSGTLEEIAEGDQVTFETEDGRRGPQAINVKKVEAI